MSLTPLKISQMQVVEELDDNAFFPVIVRVSGDQYENKRISKENLNIGSGNFEGILDVEKGGTGLDTVNVGRLLFGNGTNPLGSSSNLFWDNTNNRLGILNASPAYSLDVNGTINAVSGFKINGQDFNEIFASVIHDHAASDITSGNFGVTRGGTGKTSVTAYMPLLGGTSSTGAFQSVSNSGISSGAPLICKGSSAVPVYEALNLAGGIGIVTGTLPAVNGGTGVNNETRTLTINNASKTISGAGSTIALGANLTIATGAITLTGNAGGSSALTLPNNTTVLSALTANKILFASAANTIGFISNMTWDGTNNRLGILNASPAYSLDVNGTINAVSGFKINGQDFNEIFASVIHDHAASDITSGNFGVTRGGTGKTSVTAYMPLLGGTSSTGAFQSVSNSGISSGAPLICKGSSAVPVFEALNLAGGIGTVTGTLPVANGGTGRSSLTSNRILITPNANDIYTSSSLQWDNTNLVASIGSANHKYSNTLVDSQTNAASEYVVAKITLGNTSSNCHIRLKIWGQTTSTIGITEADVIIRSASSGASINYAYFRQKNIRETYLLNIKIYKVTGERSVVITFTPSSILQCYGFELNSIHRHTTSTSIPQNSRLLASDHPDYANFSTTGVAERNVYGMNTTGFGFGTSNPGAMLHVVGDAYITGAVTFSYTSDKFLKKNIKSLENILPRIDRLFTGSFNWNDKAKALSNNFGDELNYGLIAQDLEQEFPELIKPIFNHYKGIDYIQLIPIIIAGMKEQNQIIRDLKQEIKTLKNA